MVTVVVVRELVVCSLLDLFNDTLLTVMLRSMQRLMLE